MFMVCFISLQYAKSVIGVELIEDAVKDAEKNAKLNGKKMLYFVVYWIKCDLSDFREVYQHSLIFECLNLGISSNCQLIQIMKCCLWISQMFY